MSLYAPLPVELSRAVAEGRPMAAARLLLWALVVGAHAEGRKPDSERWLASRVGASHAWVHTELPAIREHIATLEAL